jgi:hypothetical protein
MTFPDRHRRRSLELASDVREVVIVICGLAHSLRQLGSRVFRPDV